MTDDGQRLRGSSSLGEAEPQGRGAADGFAAFTMNKPAVTVVVKKRRGAAPRPGEERADAASPRGGARAEERRPRVYQVGMPAVGAGSPAPAGASLPEVPADDSPPGPAGAGATPPRRRRARRDPTRAPGEVTRIVFEPPPSPPSLPAAEPGDPAPPRFQFMEPAEVGYEQVMAELQQVRERLDLALSARRFRIG